MQQNLKNTIVNIYDASQQLATSAEEMSSVMTQSTRDLQQQNNEIEKAAIAVTQMSSTAKEVAKNAEFASHLSKTSDSRAQNGQQIVNQSINRWRSRGLIEPVPTTAEII
ncbi:methyl-accepting chemotaxis protein [Vibrio fluvialis]|uniref:methyl-accepting chemotaxis protein n=1 Tax=Vibrio fluvialis TaxID=676 RepID=UPI00257476D9|nr:methyl-accepting chemotaxis protein [Vibrio fluvialis]BEI22787.1 hypothetical protein KKIDH5335_11190 [Vibrio fluvialis]